MTKRLHPHLFISSVICFWSLTRTCIHYIYAIIITELSNTKSLSTHFLFGIRTINVAIEQINVCDSGYHWLVWGVYRRFVRNTGVHRIVFLVNKHTCYIHCQMIESILEFSGLNRDGFKGVLKSAYASYLVLLKVVF